MTANGTAASSIDASLQSSNESIEASFLLIGSVLAEGLTSLRFRSPISFKAASCIESDSSFAIRFACAVSMARLSRRLVADSFEESWRNEIATRQHSATY